MASLPIGWTWLAFWSTWGSTLVIVLMNSAMPFVAIFATSRANILGRA
jgi:hypothetical protein